MTQHNAQVLAEQIAEQARNIDFQNKMLVAINYLKSSVPGIYQNDPK